MGFFRGFFTVWTTFFGHIQQYLAFLKLIFDHFQELVLDEDGKKVTERTCYPGNNNHGMVAWKIDLKTPEYPKGREIVVIANDISHQIGLSKNL